MSRTSSNQPLLILGAKGMLGHELMTVFQDFDPVGLDRDEIDVADQKDLMEKLQTISPRLIINAAAYTAVDDCETNTETAMLVNGKALGYLAEISESLETTLVHYSTDYVFWGDKEEGYQEKDTPHPINIYGESKLLGERLLQEKSSRCYLIRTSWLFGYHGKNFVDTILRLGREQSEVKVVSDQFGKPTFAMDLAQRTREILDQKSPYEIYHVTNEGVTSWYEFAKEIFRLRGVKTPLRAVSTSEFPRPARRPRYSTLLNTKLPPLRHWKKALGDYLNNTDSTMQVSKT